MISLPTRMAKMKRMMLNVTSFWRSQNPQTLLTGVLIDITTLNNFVSIYLDICASDNTVISPVGIHIQHPTEVYTDAHQRITSLPRIHDGSSQPWLHLGINCRVLKNTNPGASA